MLIEDPSGKVKFVNLLKVNVLSMKKPEIKLMISAARLDWSCVLTLFDMGIMMPLPPSPPPPPKKNVFGHCAQTLRRKKLKLGDFYYKSMEHQKKLFLVPSVIRCYCSNKFVREYSRFSKVIVPYVSL